jgi:hypothetical protein
MAKLMWDASTPPAAPPPGFSAAAGYLGGDTPHVWTRAEWRRVGSLAKLPIWVRSDPGGGVEGVADAGNALHQLYAIDARPGCTVALDLETAAAVPYVTAFHSVMGFFGYRVWVYGSRSTVFANPECDGYWVADYTGEPHYPAHPAVRACQYQAGPAVDRSVVRWWQWRNRLWR